MSDSHRIMGYGHYGVTGFKVVCSCGWWHACRTEEIGQRLHGEHVSERDVQTVQSDYRAELDALKVPVRVEKYDYANGGKSVEIYVRSTEERIAALTDLCERVVAELEQRHGYGVLVCEICGASFTTTNKMSAHHSLHAKAERLGALLDEALHFLRGTMMMRNDETIRKGLIHRINQECSQ